MKTLPPLLAVLLAACAARPPTAGTAAVTSGGTASIVITRAGSQASTLGVASSFTGEVVVDPLFEPNAYRHAAASNVAFEPGARTAWHTHPGGQTLVVTSGMGWLQEWGGERQILRAGDVVWIPPAVKHWHGATPTTRMTHLAIQEPSNGALVEWLEPVSQDQYDP